ncbi:MAG: DUF1922 domain-containing protein [Methanosphaera sp.]|nr:DUF1922 domain-containing protein [Methanosphaera sp.]
MAYIIYRCDCGRVLYSKDTSKTRKCPCGKTINTKNRRILETVETSRQATETVQQMQEEIYGGIRFKSANEL